jgi:LysM repeat protein
VRSSTFRALTGAALTAGLLGATAGTAAADDYEVEPGDTLAGIAERHDDVTWRDLLEANSDQISDPAVIVPGQVIAISEEALEDTHEVESGETLAEIAGLYDHVASWQALAEANAGTIGDPNLLIPGDVITLTGAESAPAAPQEEPAPEPEPEPEADAETATEPEPEPQPEQTTATDAGVWERLAQCESNGDWSINTGNGFYGGLQFTLESWEAVGGSGYPHEASREEQIQRAEQLQAIQGWGAWPACADQLGLR